MSVANKTFRNNKTGQIVKVIDAFENIAILENKQKIDVRALMDPNQYTEQIDPNSFFNNQTAYNDLANKIKNIKTNELVDDEGKVSVVIEGDNIYKPATSELAIIETTEEFEKQELIKKYGTQAKNTDLNRQKDAFDKLLDEQNDQNQKDDQNQPITRIEVDRNETVHTEKEDPIITMFRNIKRNVDFNINIDFSDKIPRLDFIEMMEDSYNVSLIDFLSDEFTDKILNNPSIIRDIIKEKINELVYKGKKKIELPKVDPSKVKKLNEGVKLSAKERAKLISEMTNKKDIEKYIKSEKAKTVLKAAEERIIELKNNQ